MFVFRLRKLFYFFSRATVAYYMFNHGFLNGISYEKDKYFLQDLKKNSDWNIWNTKLAIIMITADSIIFVIKKFHTLNFHLANNNITVPYVQQQHQERTHGQLFGSDEHKRSRKKNIREKSIFFVKCKRTQFRKTMNNLTQKILHFSEKQIELNSRISNHFINFRFVLYNLFS